MYTKGSLENNTMKRLSPLMNKPRLKGRPKTAVPRPLTAQGRGELGSAENFEALERSFRSPAEGSRGNLGEDGSRGGLRLGWVSQQQENRPEQYTGRSASSAAS